MSLFDKLEQDSPRDEQSAELSKKAKPHYHGHRARLKDKFVKSLKNASLNNFDDYELLEMILFAAYIRKDVKPIAKNLLATFGSITAVFTASHERLKAECGLNQAAIVQIKAIFEIFIRLQKASVAAKPILQSWDKLLEYCRSCMGMLDVEQFRVLFLDRKNNLLADEVMQQGTVDQTAVYPREIAKRALELSSSAVILVHNHPSGDPRPSKADIDMTEQIEHSLQVFAIKIHDHLIIAKDKHFSFAGNGLL